MYLLLPALLPLCALRQYSTTLWQSLTARYTKHNNTKKDMTKFSPYPYFYKKEKPSITLGFSPLSLTNYRRTDHLASVAAPKRAFFNYSRVRQNVKHFVNILCKNSQPIIIIMSVFVKCRFSSKSFWDFFQNIIDNEHLFD